MKQLANPIHKDNNQPLDHIQLVIPYRRRSKRVVFLWPQNAAEHRGSNDRVHVRAAHHLPVHVFARLQVALRLFEATLREPRVCQTGLRLSRYVLLLLVCLALLVGLRRNHQHPSARCHEHRRRQYHARLVLDFR